MNDLYLIKFHNYEHVKYWFDYCKEKYEDLISESIKSTLEIHFYCDVNVQFVYDDYRVKGYKNYKEISLQDLHKMLFIKSRKPKIENFTFEGGIVDYMKYSQELDKFIKEIIDTKM